MHGAGLTAWRPGILMFAILVSRYFAQGTRQVLKFVRSMSSASTATFRPIHFWFFDLFTLSMVGF